LESFVERYCVERAYFVTTKALQQGIALNLEAIHGRIVAAAQRAGRDPAEIRLIAVSKTHPAELVLAALAAGQRDFGENRVQEAEAKIEALADQRATLRWH